MKNSIFISIVIAFFNCGCATQIDYNLHGFYKSQNNRLNLVSKLHIWKSGNYIICTSTLDHEKEVAGSGNYYCIAGVWTQQKNKVTLTADTYEDKLLSFPAENGSIEILESAENLANPTALSILQPSGATMADVSVTRGKAQKVNGWSKYQRNEISY